MKRTLLALAAAAAAIAVAQAQTGAPTAASPLELRPQAAVDLATVVDELDPLPPPAPIVVSGATPTEEETLLGAEGDDVAQEAGEKPVEVLPEVRALALAPEFSVLDVLPMRSPGLLSTAERVTTPMLAGGRRADSDRGLLAGGAARFSATGPRRLSETTVAGGLVGKGLFGALRFSLGGEFGDEGGIRPFGRLDAAIEYDKYLGEDGGEKGIAIGLSSGFAGEAPIPWVLAGRVLLKDAAPEGGRGILLLEAGDRIAELGAFGTLGAFGGLGLELRASESAFLRDDLIVRGRIELEGRRYRGALARGLAAWAAGEARYDILAKDYREEYRCGAEAAASFGGFAGITLAAAFRSGTDALGDWAAGLRGVSDRTRPIAGDMGATLRLEAPVLFARGILFLDPRRGVEFFLAPYLDAALVRSGPSAALFDRSSLYLAAGGELAMTIDRDRRQALRVSGGLDLSPLLKGAATGIDSSDLEIHAVFAFVF